MTVDIELMQDYNAEEKQETLTSPVVSTPIPALL